MNARKKQNKNTTITKQNTADALCCCTEASTFEVGPDQAAEKKKHKLIGFFFAVDC